MCGGNFHSEYKGFARKKESPIWRVTADGKHIVFYGDTGQCYGATTWCKKHCHIKTIPADALTNIEPKYRIDYFLKPVKKEMSLDFNRAKYVTMFGSGTVDFQFTYGSMGRVIKDIAKEHPTKIFRFFIRRRIVEDSYFLTADMPENIRLIFSMDKDTDVDLAQWALDSEIVSSLAIVNHKDNRFLIGYLKTKLPTVNCEECNDIGYDCFKKQDKNLLLLKYFS